MREPSLTLPGLFGDMRLLVILFIAFRITLLLAFPPFLIQGEERGIGVGGDRVYHYTLVAQAEDNLYPFRDWWSEFPPAWYLTTTGLYSIGARSYDAWSIAVAILCLLSEVGTLILVRRIGARLHSPNTGMALAWVYALLAAPAIYMWWNFDSWVTFFLLLGLYWLLEHKDKRSAIAVTIGALIKFVPFLIFGAALRYRSLKQAALYIGIAVGLFVLAYVPLFAMNSNFALISLTAQFNKPSYQTVWALLDQNYGTGNFGSIESHRTAEGVTDGVSDKNPALIPAWVRLGMAALIGIGVFVTTQRRDDLGVVAFVGITLLIFYLQSQGWSPQWLAQILPLILLVFPTRDGVLIGVVLSLLAFAEYPFLFVRTGDTGGLMLPGTPLFLPWVLTVLLRTGLLAMVTVMFYGKLRQMGRST
jgi:hypothetical protein